MGGLERPDFCTEMEEEGLIEDLTVEEKLTCGIDTTLEGGSYFAENQPTSNENIELLTATEHVPTEAEIAEITEASDLKREAEELAEMEAYFLGRNAGTNNGGY